MVSSVVDKRDSCWKSLQAFPLDEVEFLAISSGPYQKAAFIGILLAFMPVSLSKECCNFW